MKTYHSIPRYSEEYFGKHIFAFDKIDGSNFRAEWSKKLSKKSAFTYGFGKFGTRGEMIKNYNNPFSEGVDIFKDKYSVELDKIFRENKRFQGIDRITVYGEFYGDHSFAGLHDWDEEHDIKIFDVFLYKKGFLPPAEFMKIFQDINTCNFIWSGIFSQEFVDTIENDSILGLKEGVVCKGVENQEVFMFKLKTKKWLDKVRAISGNTDY